MQAPVPPHPAVTVLAVVPARGGSKGLPGKNLAVVGSQSLVARAVAVARAVQSITDVVVSSDSDDILAEGQRAGAAVHRRPAELATDTASLDDLGRVLLEARSGTAVLVVLQPTSPLRAPDDVERCLSALEYAHTATTAVRLSHPVEWTFRLREGRVDPVLGWEGCTRRRQELEPAYQLNGAVYAARADHLRAGGRLVEPGTAVTEMPAERSVDIDSEFDLAVARVLAE